MDTELLWQQRRDGGSVYYGCDGSGSYSYSNTGFNADAYSNTDTF